MASSFTTSLTLFSPANLIPAATCLGDVALTAYLGWFPMVQLSVAPAGGSTRGTHLVASVLAQSSWLLCLPGALIPLRVDLGACLVVEEGA